MVICICVGNDFFAVTVPLLQKLQKLLQGRAVGCYHQSQIGKTLTKPVSNKKNKKIIFLGLKRKRIYGTAIDCKVLQVRHLLAHRRWI
jgi:hypothetical protein